MLRNRRLVHVGVARTMAVATLALTSTLAAAPGFAQSVDIQGTTEVGVPRANFRAGCSMSAEVVATLLEGDEVEVLGGAGDWYRVRHTESGIEGCMHRTVLGPVTPLAEEEIDEPEEREEENREREAEAREAELEAERERREAELEASEEELERRTAQRRRGARQEGRVSGWLELGYGVAALGTESYGWEEFGGPPTADRSGNIVGPGRFNLGHSYDYSEGEAITGGGGVLFGQWGGGILISRQTYEDPADVVWFESDPRFDFPPGLPPIAIQERFPQDLEREETAIHLHGVWAPDLGRRISVRVFAGPTYFRLSHDLVSAVGAQFDGNAWHLAQPGPDTQKASAWGGHVGGDFTYYFTRRFGLGVGALFSSGTVELEDTWAVVEIGKPHELRDVDVGGLQIVAGVRFRLGRQGVNR